MSDEAVVRAGKASRDCAIESDSGTNLEHDFAPTGTRIRFGLPGGLEPEINFLCRCFMAVGSDIMSIRSCTMVHGVRTKREYCHEVSGVCQVKHL